MVNYTWKALRPNPKTCLSGVTSTGLYLLQVLPGGARPRPMRYHVAMATFSRRHVLAALTAAPALILARKSAAQDSLPAIAKGPFDGSADSLKAYADAGVDRLIVYPLPVEDEAAVDRFVAEQAEVVLG